MMPRKKKAEPALLRTSHWVARHKRDSTRQRFRIAHHQIVCETPSLVGSGFTLSGVEIRWRMRPREKLSWKALGRVAIGLVGWSDYTALSSSFFTHAVELSSLSGNLLFLARLNRSAEPLCARLLESRPEVGIFSSPSGRAHHRDE